MLSSPFIGYVSTPFGTKNDTDFDALYEDGIFAATNVAMPNDDVLLFREDAGAAWRPPWSARHRTRIARFRGSQETREWQLREAIQENIVGADFVVAVITDFNPNVMLEVGFAQAQKKIIIYVLQRDQMAGLPRNLENLKRLHLYKSTDNLRVNLYTRIREAIADLMHQHHEAAASLGYSLDYFPNRDSVRLAQKFRDAQHTVQILTTNLTTVSANFIDAIVSAVTHHDQLTVKILTSDPENLFIDPRADQLLDDKTGYRMELAGSLESIRAKLKQFPRCEVRTYKDFPVQLWHRVDDYIYIGQLSLVRRARHNCVFGASVDMEGVKETYLDHFDLLWSKPSTAPSGA